MRQLFGYADDTKKNRDEIAKLESKLETVVGVTKQILSDTDTDRQLAERDKRIAEEQRQNLLLRLENILLKNDVLALPSGASAPQTEIAELRARVIALEKEVEEHKIRLAELESAR